MAERSTKGLSPRVRGNHHLASGDSIWVGSIPACAGEPDSGRGIWSLCAVYPRVCGGTVPGSTVDDAFAGLSPRVRGNRVGAEKERVLVRSIPACAGEPPGSTGPGSTGAVYPRVCGGTWIRANDPLLVEGLSPRVRGNLIGPAVGQRAVGSIPACAGEPQWSILFGFSNEVYPRVCGGTQSVQSPHWSRQGLSPRVRGNRHAVLRGSARQRSIPACAGEPSSGPRSE